MNTNTTAPRPVVSVNGKVIVCESMVEAINRGRFAEIVNIDAEIERLSQRRKMLVTGLWEGLANGDTGKYVLSGQGEITFSENNVYSDKVMESILKPGQMRLVTKRVIDRAKVKSLYPRVYAASKTYLGPKASVKAYK